MLTAEHMEPDHALKYIFNVASTGEMRKLGMVFARAVLPQPSATLPPLGACEQPLSLRFWEKREKVLPIGGRTGDPVVRIGLCARMNAGKTTFVQGMLKAAGPKALVADTISCARKQGLWYAPEVGTIRHYDCMTQGLSRHWSQDPAKCGTPRVDLVEHPYKTISERKAFFDSLVYISYRPHENENNRRVAIDVTPELESKPGFQSFLTECARLRI